MSTKIYHCKLSFKFNFQEYIVLFITKRTLQKKKLLLYLNHHKRYINNYKPRGLNHFTRESGCGYCTLCVDITAVLTISLLAKIM